VHLKALYKGGRKMSITNILITGVGGQGLVLATKVLAETAFQEGYDVKTSDVIGLSQRGGMIWGSVRFGEKVHSPLIPKGQVDILLAMEELEGLRWIKDLKKDASVILNQYSIFPNKVLIEKNEYPEKIKEAFESKNYNLSSINALDMSKTLGSTKVSNIVLLGRLSTLLPFKLETWLKVIESNVPPKTTELNIKAFQAGTLQE
jgi:indolepyruvate ferredoxin oxidoreductase beta subunit